MALHKMIRLITFALGGNGYLNFMGNEFGHPEWIDFPREGNDWSYHYCRRRWDLATDQNLRYQYLGVFDSAMIKLDKVYGILCSEYQFIRTKNNSDKILIFEKGNLVFVFNWHHSQSYQSYHVYATMCSELQVVWSTDDECFGGHSRVGHQCYEMIKHDSSCGYFEMYIPNRTATVLLRK